MRGKKGQTQQVFIYIMVIIVVGAVLLFGYRAIIKLMNQSCDVDMTTFQAELKATLEKNNGYGDVALKSFKSPCGYDKICFINSSTEGVDRTILRQINGFVADEVIAGTGNNVFIIKGSTVKPLYGLDFLEVPGNSTAKGFVCLDAKSSTFYLSLEGIGKGRVKITPGS